MVPGPAEQVGQGVLEAGALHGDLAAVDGDLGAGQDGQWGPGELRELEGDPGGPSGDHLGDGAGGDDPAAVHDGQPVGELLGLLQIVGGEQHRGALGAQLADQPPDGGPGLRVEAGAGLVQEEHLGAAEQGHREVEPAPFAAGQLLDPDAGPVAEADQLQGLRDRAGAAGHPGPGAAGLRGGELTGEAALLEHDADPRPDGGALLEGVVAEHPDGAAAGRGQPLDELQGGGLAGAVGAEQGEQLAAADGEVDAADGVVLGGAGAVVAVQVGDLDHAVAGAAGLARFHAPSLPPPRARGQCAPSRVGSADPRVGDDKCHGGKGEWGKPEYVEGPLDRGGLRSGADDEIRTRDPHLGKVMLYQLSHVRMVKLLSCAVLAHCERTTRFELATLTLAR